MFRLNLVLCVLKDINKSVNSTLRRVSLIVEIKDINEIRADDTVTSFRSSTTQSVNETKHDESRDNLLNR